jgi:hypothetical protein
LLQGGQYRDMIAYMDEPQRFDAAAVVATYCHVLARLYAEETEAGRAELDSIAKRLRVAWKSWQGDDSLHEMTFGEH